MSQIIRKFLSNDAVDGSKIKLQNNQYLKARNAADSADVNIIKLNASDVIEFNSFPQKSGTPSTANELVNKSYVDGLMAGLAWKAPVVVATTADITLSGEQTIDGVLTSASRVLVKNQTDGEDNGIYVSAAGSWARATDMDLAAETDSAAVFVSQGSANGNKAFVQTADSVTLGTTPLVFVQFSDTTAAVITNEKETFVLDGTDITNQYVDLANVARTDSITFMVQGSGALLEGASYDYSVSYTGGAGGNTRITFLNDLATGGGAALIATDVVQVKYEY